MLKKLLGIFLFLLSVLMVVGGIVNETIFRNFGSMIGVLLPVLVNLCAGVFLFVFGRIDRKSFIDGFHGRKTQCKLILLFTVLYGVLTIMSCIGGGLSMSYDDSFILTYVTAIFPFFIPLMIFTVLLGLYAIPYWSCKKRCNLDSAAIEEYLSPSELYFSYSEDNAVVANSLVVFFPKLFCPIPFDMIEQIKFYKGLEQDIIFVLTTGKKLTIPANKKQYNCLVSIMNAGKH